MIQQFSRPTGCASILDPVSLNRAAKHGFRGLEAGESLLFFALSLIFGTVIGIAWWRYDLLSTWNFSQGIRDDMQPTADLVTQKATELASGDITLNAFIGGAIVVAITLAPSIVELIAPRVMHPGAQLILNATILFDYITDWPTGWAIVARYEVPMGWIGQIVVTALVTLALSLFIQILFILCLTVSITCALNIIKPVSQNGNGAIIIQG